MVLWSSVKAGEVFGSESEESAEVWQWAPTAALVVRGGSAVGRVGNGDPEALHGGDSNFGSRGGTRESTLSM